MSSKPDEPVVEDDDNAVLRTQVRLYEELFEQQRHETKGLLGSAPIFRKAVKESTLFLAEQQGGILNLVKSMTRPKVPWTLIGMLVVMVSVIGMFSARPEYGKEMGLFFSLQQNQFFLIIVLVIVMVIMLIVIRRRRQSY